MTCLVAFLTAGLFEYNFGDSEVLILLLFFAAAPYAAGKRVGQAVPEAEPEVEEEQLERQPALLDA